MQNVITINPTEVTETPKHAFLHELCGSVTYNVTVAACCMCCRLVLIFDSSMNRTPNENDLHNVGWRKDQDSWYCPICIDTEDKTV